MTTEFIALLKKNTWFLIPKPSDKNIVSNKWLFRIKRNVDGTIECYKDRLVARGYTQESSVDYTEIFSPMVKYTTIHTVLAIVTTHKWPIRQLDISNAFLYGFLDTEIYME